MGGRAIGRWIDPVFPLADTKSPSCGGKIVDGRFSVLPSGGASPGTFRVEITASRNTGRKVINPRDGALIDEIVQYIPPRYNRNSELKATVGDQSDNRFEFVLTSK